MVTVWYVFSVLLFSTCLCLIINKMYVINSKYLDFVLFFLPSLTICFWIGLFSTFILSLSIYIVGYMSAICYLFSVCLRFFSFLSIFSLLPSFVLNIFSVPFKSLCQLCVCLCVFVLCISVSFTYHNLFYINPYLIPVKYRNFATA